MRKNNALFSKVSGMLTLVNKARLMRYTKLTLENVKTNEVGPGTSYEEEQKAMKIVAEMETEVDAYFLQETLLCLPDHEYNTSRKE